jgi:hypothetical protein
MLKEKTVLNDIASKMTISDSETLTKTKHEGKFKESGAKLDIQNSLPEVLSFWTMMMEIKDQEIILDDLYSPNLSKLDE